MAMNNWGGIKEHMTKKPRKVFSERKLYKSANKGELKKTKITLDKEKIKKERSKKYIKELIWYVGISLTIIMVIYLFKYFWQ